MALSLRSVASLVPACSLGSCCFPLQQRSDLETDTHVDSNRLGFYCECSIQRANWSWVQNDWELHCFHFSTVLFRFLPLQTAVRVCLPYLSHTHTWVTSTSLLCFISAVEHSTAHQSKHPNATYNHVWQPLVWIADCVHSVRECTANYFPVTFR